MSNPASVQDAPSPPPLRVTDIPEQERPREKLARLGAQSLTDAELLAVFFRTGLQGLNAIELGSSLCQKYGGLTELSRLTVEELCNSNKGIGPAKATELVAVFEMGRRLASQRMVETPLNKPDLIYAVMAPEMQQLSRESLRVILLNSRYRLVKVEEVSSGTINETVAHPRDILKPAIVHDCHAFIVVHNHPSGDPSPSQADRKLTRRLIEAAELMRIEMLDHIIIGRPRDENPNGYFSFNEQGLM